MNKMHENELEIDEDLVRTLLQSQCPDWAHLPLKAVPSSGTEASLFRLGDNYVVRLPRLAGADANINKEYEWVPKIAQQLKTPLSLPLFKGHAHPTYPSSWVISQWNDGVNPPFEQENEYGLLAQDLGHFINKFQRLDLAHGPLSRRGVPLNQLDQQTKRALDELQGEIDCHKVANLWDQLISIPLWPHDPVWIHGDLLPGNILIQDNRLKAVIDFSDVGIGDPACDLIIAWALLNPPSRKIFQTTLENKDENTWQRGRGWALSIALIMLPYYKNTNPAFASLARRMIKHVVES